MAQIKDDLALYWKVKGEISVCNDVLLYGTRIVVPKSLQTETLQKIHQGHQGIHKCHQQVSSSVWWPDVTKDIKDLVKSCHNCQKATPQSI